MPDRSYDWLEYREKLWLERFPSWAHGYGEWRNQPPPEVWLDQALGEGSLPFAPDWLPRPSERDVVRPFRAETFEFHTVTRETPLRCPRVFISHRKNDRDRAERVASLAQQVGMDYWLDVHDPYLKSLPPNLSPEQRGRAIAAIIEMALLNCSHLIALITPNTPGTQWVPYEYGRVKELPPVSIQAACYRHPQVTDRNFPEYLHLGVVTHSDAAVRQWLWTSRINWVNVFNKCENVRASWTGAVPQPLPGQD